VVAVPLITSYLILSVKIIIYMLSFVNDVTLFSYGNCCKLVIKIRCVFLCCARFITPTSALC